MSPTLQKNNVPKAVPLHGPSGPFPFMRPGDWIALAGILLTAVFFVVGILRYHASKDRQFQDETGKEQAKTAEKIRRLEGDYELLHQWKNIRFQEALERQSANVLNVIDRIEKDVNRRLDRIEKHLNGHLK